MDRVAVFCFYDRDGILDEADSYLINELKRNVSQLIVVVNGEIKNIDDLNMICDTVICRENYSYDAGAYEEVFNNELCWKRIKSCDELVLCNNSFYGPFKPFEDIFKYMDAQECDFWGLLEHKHFIYDYVPSFFWVIRKEIIESGIIFNYFDKHIKGRKLTYEEVYSVFERGLFHAIVDSGYTFKTYLKRTLCAFYKNSYGSLAIDGLPVLKKKAFARGEYRKKITNAAVSFIRMNYSYPTQLIEMSVSRLYKRKIDKLKELEVRVNIDMYSLPDRITEGDLWDFIGKYSRVYIYGVGFWAEEIYSSFIFYPDNEKLAGFIVSDDELGNNPRKYYGYNVYTLSEVKLLQCEGIIVAMSRENSIQIKEKLLFCPRVMYLWKLL